MANRFNKPIVGVLSTALVAAAIFAGTAAAQKDSVPKPQNQLALAEDHVKQVLLLMEADKQGKISKQQFMKFMEAEFERLDVTKTGQLDVKQLTRPTITAKNYVGK
jgi:hypothetical protein